MPRRTVSFSVLLPVVPTNYLPFQSDSVSQGDVACFKALASAPDEGKYPHAARWYKHVASYEGEFNTLVGDASKPYTAYGPAADDDDDDLFSSDEDDDDPEAARVREERLAEYKKKKDAKPKTVAKSVVTLDVKPWGTFVRCNSPSYSDTDKPPRADDETDMVALEAAVRAIEKDGLNWGASKLVPLGYGIQKLQINLVVEDEKISVSDLEEEIQELEDYVQSTDVAAMQKL